MLYDLDFVSYIKRMTDEDQQADRRVMARVALNALYDSEAYPVDLSEILRLHSINRSLTRAFLLGCSLRPEVFQSWSDGGCAALVELASGIREETS